MNYLIQDHLDLVSSADDNRLTREMSDLKTSGGTDLYDLLPKMMGAYAKRAKNDDVKKSMLSNVLNAIDNARSSVQVVGAPVAPLEGVVAPSIPTDRDSLTGGEIGKSDPVSRGPELSTRKVGGVPDLPTRIASDTRPDAPTLQDSITGPTAPVSTGSTSGVDSLTSMANDLKANVVKHMKIYMPLEQTDYEGVTLDYTRDSFDENDHEFPLAIEHYLSRINMDGSLSETDRKIKAIYDDLVSMKNPDNSEYKTLFERRGFVSHGKKHCY